MQRRAERLKPMLLRRMRLARPRRWWRNLNPCAKYHFGVYHAYPEVMLVRIYTMIAGRSIVAVRSRRPNRATETDRAAWIFFQRGRCFGVRLSRI